MDGEPLNGDGPLNDSEPLKDSEAVARALDGDLSAYEALVVRYSTLAHRTAMMLGAGDEADDIVQEAFVKAFRHLRSFRRDSPFKPWLLRIVANETHNLTRARGRRQDLAARVGTVTHQVAPDDPAGTAIATDRRARLLKGLRVLPDREREAVVCRYLLQLSEAETAQVLGWKIGTVKSRTHRGLARLREEVGHDLA